jgi:hypothetical protein
MTLLGVKLRRCLRTIMSGRAGFWFTPLLSCRDPCSNRISFPTTSFLWDGCEWRLLWVGLRRTEVSFRAGLMELGKGALLGVGFVCSDMWRPFRAARARGAQPRPAAGCAGDQRAERRAAKLNSQPGKTLCRAGPEFAHLQTQLPEHLHPEVAQGRRIERIKREVLSVFEAATGEQDRQIGRVMA